MLANDGRHEGRGIISSESVREMTRDQTAGLNNPEYGYGIATKRNTFGHGGAYSTMTLYDQDTRLITGFLVQQVKWHKEGGKVSGEFQKAAAKTFFGTAAAESAVTPEGLAR